MEKAEAQREEAEVAVLVCFYSALFSSPFAIVPDLAELEVAVLRLQEHETLATRLGNVIAVFAGTGTWDPTAVTRFAVAATRKRKPPQSRTVSWAITDTVTASNDDLLRDEIDVGSPHGATATSFSKRRLTGRQSNSWPGPGSNLNRDTASSSDWSRSSSRGSWTGRDSWGGAGGGQGVLSLQTITELIEKLGSQHAGGSAAKLLAAMGGMTVAGAATRDKQEEQASIGTGAGAGGGA
eukprot:1019508-Rhodomonas_salina.3